MVQTINPVVYRAQKCRWFIGVVIYSLSCVATAAMFAFLFASIGHFLLPWDIPAYWSKSGISIMLFFYALHELKVLRLPSPQWRRQVPKQWRHEYHPYITAGLFGAQLGVGFLVHINSSAYYAFVAGLIFLSSPMEGLILGVLYGIGRILLVVMSHSINSYEEWDRFEKTWVDRHLKYIYLSAFLMSCSAGLLFFN